MLILKIRRAETALADGRLDEAFELAREQGLAAHRKGQELIGRLARALVARGRIHLDGARLPQALSDCEKALSLAGNLPEAAELRAAVKVAGRQEHDAERRCEDALAAARQHAKEGRLSIGEAALAEMPAESTRVRGLTAELAERRQAAQAALERARSALDRDDWSGALGATVEAVGLHASSNDVKELATRIAGDMSRRIWAAVDQGRPDLAEVMVARLRPLSAEGVIIGEMDRFLGQCRQASRLLRTGDPREAAGILRCLATLRPSASWLTTAAQHAAQAAEAMESVCSGPLALIGGMQHEEVADAGTATIRLPEPAPVPHAPTAPLPEKLLLHVDGAGSFLLLRSRRVTIGPAGSSRRYDIGLMAEPGLGGIAVERVDEDYFLVSDVPVRVNGRPATRRLLAHGDEITLSQRCRIRFAVPNPASTSAVLTLCGTRLPRSDARQIVLLDHSLVLGPGSPSHIRVDSLPEQAILHVRDGRLFCRSKAEVTVDDRPVDRHRGIALDGRVRVGGVSLVVTSA